MTSDADNLLFFPLVRLVRRTKDGAYIFDLTSGFPFAVTKPQRNKLMPETMIAIDKINPPAWNSRLSNDKDALQLSELGASLKVHQINAVTVEGPLPNGTYDLVTGSRRVRAARLVGMKEIRADVSPVTDPATRIVKNIVENEQRKDLTLFEQARAYAKLREIKDADGKPAMKVDDIAAATGKSKQHVSNLATMFVKLPQLVKTEWEAGSPAATFKYLQSLAQMKGETPEAVAEQQVMAWKERTEMYADFAKREAELDAKGGDAEADDSDADSDDDESDGEGGDGKEKKTSKKNGSFKVDSALARSLLAAIKKSSPPGAALAISVVKLLRGDIDKIKGVYPPPKSESDK